MLWIVSIQVGEVCRYQLNIPLINSYQLVVVGV